MGVQAVSLRMEPWAQGRPEVEMYPNEMRPEDLRADEPGAPIHVTPVFGYGATVYNERQMSVVPLLLTIYSITDPIVNQNSKDCDKH